jgi:hypothetical protein
MNEEGRAASDTLLRLVRFAAAACDARYAFVVASGPAQASPGLRCVHFWVARDYGLRTERTPLDLAADQAVPSTPVDCVLALRQIWPDEAELAGLTMAASCLTVPLLDEGGRLLGHMGILDPGPACLHGRDRLPPLGRVAAAQLAIWRSAS